MIEYKKADYFYNLNYSMIKRGKKTLEFKLLTLTYCYQLYY
jgi:hypothetical protein